VAQSWRVQAERHRSGTKKPRPPLDAEGLERLGLFYAGRYATTRAKLADYLRRKLRERGWGGTGAPPVEALVERFASLGYVDDAAFAQARTGALLRRGYGERRVSQALKAAGIGEEDAAPAREEAERGAEEAALRFARRRKIGPYAAAPLANDREGREARQKAAAAMLRAGHRLDVVRRILDASPGEVPDPDLS
jgi:regulatory protein